MRRPIIAGNWKMFKTHLEAISFVQDLWLRVSENNVVEIVICPPFTAMRSVMTVIDSDKMSIKLGAQNVFYESQGAFTGEISPPMLKTIGVSYCVVGHSERREYFFESDDVVNKKVRALYEHLMIPIMCVGESIRIREEGKALSFVKEQVKRCLDGIPEQLIRSMVIAYEPIWAIGTGKTAYPIDANEMNGEIRQTISSLYSRKIADEIRILYGGSIKSSNIAEIMVQPEVDGALVGGSSLQVDEFALIVNYNKKRP
jgi:triosephosphate isomerase